jgi:hypothetical protein
MSATVDRTTGLNIFEQTNVEPAMATASNTRACACSPTVAHTYSCTTLRMSEAYELKANTHEAHVLKASFHKAHVLRASTHEHNYFTANTFSCTQNTPYTGNRGTGVGGR